MRIDRPLGSRHPKFSALIYPVNYGYIPRTLAADGHEIDAYLVGVGKAVKRFEGRCIAIVFRRDDIEDKLVIAPGALSLSDAAIMTQLRFQERFFDAVLIR